MMELRLGVQSTRHIFRKESSQTRQGVVPIVWRKHSRSGNGFEAPKDLPCDMAAFASLSMLSASLMCCCAVRPGMLRKWGPRDALLGVDQAVEGVD